MNKLQIDFIVFITLLVINVVSFILFHAYDKSMDKKEMELPEDERPRQMTLKNNKMVRYYKRQRSYGRIIFQNVAFICLAVVLIIMTKRMMTYQSYGAFYDDSWKQPDVEEHFMFDSSDSEDLLDIYNKDPDNFEFDKYNIVMIRFGCPDCEQNKELIKKYDTNKDYYVIFSRSEIGKKYVEHYKINYVPCMIISGNVEHLK